MGVHWSKWYDPGSGSGIFRLGLGNHAVESGYFWVGAAGACGERAGGLYFWIRTFDAPSLSPPVLM